MMQEQHLNDISDDLANMVLDTDFLIEDVDSIIKQLKPYVEHNMSTNTQQNFMKELRDIKDLLLDIKGTFKFRARNLR